MNSRVCEQVSLWFLGLLLGSFPPLLVYLVQHLCDGFCLILFRVKVNSWTVILAGRGKTHFFQGSSTRYIIIHARTGHMFRRSWSTHKGLHRLSCVLLYGYSMVGFMFCFVFYSLGVIIFCFLGFGVLLLLDLGVVLFLFYLFIYSFMYVCMYLFILLSFNASWPQIPIPPLLPAYATTSHLSQIHSSLSLQNRAGLLRILGLFLEKELRVGREGGGEDVEWLGGEEEYHQNIFKF